MNGRTEGTEMDAAERAHRLNKTVEELIETSSVEEVLVSLSDVLYDRALASVGTNGLPRYNKAGLRRSWLTVAQIIERASEEAARYAL